MGFFDTYGTPRAVAKSSKPETVLQALLRGCEQQRRLLAGQPVYGATKKPIRSWFNDGRFSPKAGLFSLFDKGSIAVPTGKQAELLADFESALHAGEMDTYTRAVESKRKSAG